MRLVSCDRQKIPGCGRARQQGAPLSQARRGVCLLVARGTLCNDVLSEMPRPNLQAKKLTAALSCLLGDPLSHAVVRHSSCLPLLPGPGSWALA